MTVVTVLPAWAWLLVSTIFFAAGEFISKKFALNPAWSLFGILVLADILSLVAWLPAILEKNQLSSTGVAWSVLSLLMTALAGILFFGEKVGSLQVIGIILGIAAVVLLSI